MTVSSTISRSGPYAGAGTTGPFAVGFRFLEDAHLRVVKTSAQGVDADLSLGIDFFASGAGEVNGSVILVAPLGSRERLTILRSVPETQEADDVQNDAFPAESHERALDKLTMIAQQQAEQLGRALRLGVDRRSPVAPALLTFYQGLAATVAQNQVRFDAARVDEVRTDLAEVTSAMLGPQLGRAA